MSPPAGPLEAPPSRSAIGRPRRLTLRQIVEAGKELGLEALSVSAVALRLGVGVGTIYTYVESREQLARLVAASLAEQPPIEERGQHWANVVRAHAARNFDLLCTAPALLAQLVSGGVDPDEALADTEHVLALLVARGFAPATAFALYRGSGQIAIGAAVAAAMCHAWEQRGETRWMRTAYAFAERPDGYPHLRALGASLSQDALYCDYRPALERLLADVAAERGETLPEPA